MIDYEESVGAVTSSWYKIAARHVHVQLFGEVSLRGETTGSSAGVNDAIQPHKVYGFAVAHVPCRPTTARVESRSVVQLMLYVWHTKPPSAPDC